LTSSKNLPSFGTANPWTQAKLPAIAEREDAEVHQAKTTAATRTEKRSGALVQPQRRNAFHSF
jgi:hypothetical protein